MPRIRLSFTERRRRRLALKVDRLDRLESRNAVTPVGATALGLGAIGGMHANGGGKALIDPASARPTSRATVPAGAMGSTGAPSTISVVPPHGTGGGGTGGH